MTSEMFPDMLTKEESELGYMVEETKNPEAHYAFHLPTIKAVVFKLGQSDRIIKMECPSGNVFYKHQRYGTFTGDAKGDPSWLPYCDTFDYAPGEAILKARAGVQVESSKITPHDPQKKIT